MDQTAGSTQGQGEAGRVKGPVGTEAPRPVPVYVSSGGSGQGGRGSFLGTMGRYVLGLVFCLSLLLNVYLILIVRAGISEEEYRPGWKNQKIALIDVNDMITMEEARVFRRLLRKASDDETVKGVIVVVNSGGGQVVPSALMHKYIQDFQHPRGVLRGEGASGEEKEAGVKKGRAGAGKPVYVSIEQVGASGAYWIATAGERIYAQENAVVGSIGVIYLNMVLEGLLQEKLGIRPVVMESSRSPKKDTGSPFREPTEEERSEIQEDLDTIHKRFVEVVRQGRGLTEEAAWAAATGDVFDGLEALERGLVDKVGYLDDAIDAMAEELGLERPMVVRYSRPPTVAEALGVERLAGGADLTEQVQGWMTQPRIQALWVGQ